MVLYFLLRRGSYLARQAEIYVIILNGPRLEVRREEKETVKLFHL